MSIQLLLFDLLIQRKAYLEDVFIYGMAIPNAGIRALCFSTAHAGATSELIAPCTCDPPVFSGIVQIGSDKCGTLDLIA